MPRPIKKGLDYFPSDTNRYQDLKIRRLNKLFGCCGISVWDYVLNEIYRVEGSFIEWNENVIFAVSDYFDIKEDLVKEIIKYCCSVGLFNEKLFLTRNILTSKAIQERYLKVCSLSKRTSNNILKNINLVNSEKTLVNSEKTLVNSEKTRVNSEKTLVNSGGSTQSKVKESKVKESKILSLYHELCPNLKKVQILSELRKKTINLRLDEHHLEGLTKVFKITGESKFLNGDNKNQWAATFDWIMTPKNFIKILEGNYENKKQKTKPSFSVNS